MVCPEADTGSCGIDECASSTERVLMDQQTFLRVYSISDELSVMCVCASYVGAHMNGLDVFFFFFTCPYHLLIIIFTF